MKKLIYSLLLASALVILMANSNFAFAHDGTQHTVSTNGTWKYDELNATQPTLQYQFTIDQTAKVTIDLHTFTSYRAEIRVKDGDAILTFYDYGSINVPSLRTFSNYFNPGVYILTVFQANQDSGRIGVRLSSSYAYTTESEPNDSFNSARQIQGGQRIYALNALSDEADYFKIDNPSPRGYVLDLESNHYALNLELYDQNRVRFLTTQINLGGSSQTSVSKVVPLSFPKGTCYLCFKPTNTTEAFYSFSLEEPPAIFSIKLPKSIKIAVGFSGRIEANVTPFLSMSNPLKWSSSKNSVVTVDQNGIIEAKKKGTATITLTSSNKKVKGACKVTVTSNELRTSKPYKGKAKGLYASTKRLYYKGDKLYAEIFLYNKTGRTIRQIENLWVYVVDVKDFNPNYPSSSAVYKQSLGTWKPSGGLRNNKYAIIKASFPKGDLPTLHLPLGQYESVLAGYVTAKSANGEMAPRIANGP